MTKIVGLLFTFPFCFILAVLLNIIGFTPYHWQWWIIGTPIAILITATISAMVFE